MSEGKIVVVDDIPTNIMLLTDLLSMKGYAVATAENGTEALNIIHSEIPDLVLLDINMPEIDGFEVCRRLKADTSVSHIPVIFLSALSDTENKLQGFDVGGVDFITKPFKPKEVIARVQTHMRLERQRKEIQELTQKLQESVQLKDEVLGIASHDLKNPLGVIMGYMGVLEEDMEMDGLMNETYAMYIGGVNRAAEKIRNLIMDLLDMARSESQVAMRYEQVSLAGFLELCVDDYRFSAEEAQQTLTYQALDPDIKVEIDPPRMQQVLSNLLSNAIKYSPEGGTVTLSARYDDDGVYIAVSDTGIGIPEKDIPHLFDKFFRVQDEAHLQKTGTGLGMSIVKGIVDQHGGNIVVESAEGEGSTFTVVLPASVIVAG